MHNVNLVDDEGARLVGEKGFDGMEELKLGFNGIPTLLREVHEVGYTHLEMRDAARAR